MSGGGFTFGSQNPAGSVFSFGQSQTTTTNANKGFLSAPATTSAGGGYGFGSLGTPSATGATTTGGFSFGSASTPLTSQTTTAPAIGGFSFGTTPTATSASGGGFSFGTPATAPLTAQTTTAPALSGFSFGTTPTTTPATSGGGFSFGGTPATGTSTSTGFSFGGGTLTPAVTSTSSGTGFSFGGTSTGTTPASTSGFSFGGLGGTAPALQSTGFSFGNTTPTTSAKPAAFGFDKNMRMDQGGKFQTESKAIVHTSYAVSLLVAKAKKPHSIGETLIKPCLVSCAGILLGESAVSKMKQVSLSNDTVKSRIFDMSCNIKSQLLAKVKASPVFAIQLDESVDVANLSQLIVFVRYVHDQSIEEDLLFCRPLETTTQAADVMQLVDAFFEEEGLDWGKLVHACTDGAPAMLGARSGFAKLLKQKNPKVVTMHCIIHREALASRTMTQPLKEALETAIKLVNFVKASALNTRLFRRLCQDMESDYEGLLFHTAVRWLSKGDMLNRLVHLLPEVTQFLEERNKGDLKAAISDEAFQCRLALLADMFSHLNELNRKLQGADSDIIGHRDKVNAFVSKLELWRGKFETGRSATAFPTLARISETAGGVSDVLKNEAIIHLNRLLDEFQHYFPDFNSNNPMMEFTRDPFSFRVDNFPKEAEDIEDQFLDLVHDSAAKAVFAEKSLNAFWATMHGSYPRVAVAALTLLVAFPSTYLCESAFSSMVEIKTKSRNRLIDLESDLRCAISKVEPNIETLVKAKQMQKSH